MLSRRARHFSSILCLALCAAPLAGPGLTPAAAQSTSGPSHGDPPRRDDRDGGNDLVPLVAGGLALLGGALLVDSLTGKDWASPKTLDRDGPVFPKRLSPGQFQVQGYAMPGWPVVVDLSSAAGAETWLMVQYRGMKKKDRLRFRIPGEGRRVQVVRLPSSGAAQPVAARYSLVSFRTVKGKKRYQPHQVHGIGAGPRAVGSTTLQIDSLSPALARQAADVHYSLVSRRRFDRSTIEVLRLPGGTKGGLKMVKAERRFPLPPGTHTGDWRAMKVDPRPAAGLYHFQARAWLVGGRGDERDWTGAIAPNFVRVR